MNINGVSDFFTGILHILQTISFIDILDILLVSIVLYFAYRFVHERRAGRLAAGVIFVIVILILGDIFGMHVVQYFSKNLLQVGIIAIIILFQPEIRSALEKMGDGSIKGIKQISNTHKDYYLLTIRETVNAVCQLSSEKTGALIIFERNTKLGEIISTGTILEANTSSYLLRNIFFNKSPLHDGAVIISMDGKIKAAACLLPLSNDSNLSKSLGTRHRAAIGVSETSDCISIVVSEETGTISLAIDGKLNRGFDETSLRNELINLLINTDNKHNKHNKRKDK